MLDVQTLLRYVLPSILVVRSDVQKSVTKCFHFASYYMERSENVYKLKATMFRMWKQIVEAPIKDIK